MLIDSHCHLASHRFAENEASTLIENALNTGVKGMVTLATSLDDIQANLAIATRPAVHACVGIHPCDVHHAPDDAVSQLAAFTTDQRVCALGETGLDYYHPAPDGWCEETFRQRQRLFLHQHFELAASCGLNVVIHTRDRDGYASFEDALAIYQKFHERTRAVFHCFIGPWENASRVIQLGGLVSFGGVVTFKNAKDVEQTALKCPAGSFMIETDSPYLAPVPHRGKRNEPSHVRYVASHLAALRGETLDELCQHTASCSFSFFRFRSAGI